MSSKLHFFMYRMFKGGELQEEKRTQTLKEYTDESAALTKASREFVDIVRKIWKDLNLELLDPNIEPVTPSNGLPATPPTHG